MEVDKDLLELDDHRVRVEATKLRDAIRDYIQGDADLDDLCYLLPDSKELLDYLDEEDANDLADIEEAEEGSYRPYSEVREELFEEKVYKPDWLRIIFISTALSALAIGGGLDYLQKAGIWDAPSVVTVCFMLSAASFSAFVMWRYEW